MENITQMIRWNASLVRGLAQSVLERAKVIRSTLKPYATDVAMGALVKSGARKITVKKAAKRPARKPAKAPAKKSSKKG
jgi:hypothetical protein